MFTLIQLPSNLSGPADLGPSGDTDPPIGLPHGSRHGRASLRDHEAEDFPAFVTEPRAEEAAYHFPSLTERGQAMNLPANDHVIA